MLETITGSKLRAKVMGWLFSHPDERYFVRQLSKLLHEDSTNISRELARLEKTGILTVTIEGKQKYYRANRTSPVFNELHGLIIKTTGAADLIRRALGPVWNEIIVAFIFGSVAGGNENRSSDIDVMIIGDIPFGRISELLYDSQERLGREINPVVYPPEEYRKRIREDNNFLLTVLREKKLFLKGDEDELNRLG